jgi:hypothetical protein
MNNVTFGLSSISQKRHRPSKSKYLDMKIHARLLYDLDNANQELL